MTKEDVLVVLSSATGKRVYIEALISRTIARKIETLLEENNVTIISPYYKTKKRNDPV